MTRFTQVIIRVVTSLVGFASIDLGFQTISFI